MSLRALKGAVILGSDTAHRTVTAADSATDLDGATWKDTTVATPVKVLGAAAVYVQCTHNQAAGTATIVLAYYDESDNLLGRGAALVCASSALTKVGALFMGKIQSDDYAGAYSVRAVCTVLTTTTSLEIFVGQLDSYPV